MVDGLMIVSVLLGMANRITENLIHESIGLFLFFLFLVHGILNWKWVGTIRRGKYNFRRMLNLMVNLLLFVTITILMGSSVMASRTLFAFLNIKSTLILRQVHTTAAYWFFLLMAVHMGVHWTGFSASLKKAFPVIAGFGLPAGLRLVLSISVLVWGTIAFSSREIFSRLFMIYAFDFWNADQAALAFFANYLAIIGAFAIISHTILKKI